MEISRTQSNDVTSYRLQSDDIAAQQENDNKKNVTKEDYMKSTNDSTRENHTATNADGDTLDITEKKSEAPNESSEKITIVDGTPKHSMNKYSDAMLRKYPKTKLKQLLTYGQITRQQYEKAMKSIEQ